MGKCLKISFVVLVCLAWSCRKDSNTQPVAGNCVYSTAANLQVNFTILNGSAQFGPISIPGGYIYVSGQNPKGILIYRLNSTQFVAYERSCTHDGCNGNKTLVWVQTGNTAVKDSTCGSTFNIMDGSLIQGPAIVQLYQYRTSWDGNQLTVYN